MLREVNTLYVDSMRKSILDYILLEEEERMRLGIMTTFDGVVLYGEELSKKVHLQIDFRAVHQDVAQRLLSYTDVSASVLNEW
jgi:dynein heavy chain